MSALSLYSQLETGNRFLEIVTTLQKVEVSADLRAEVERRSRIESQARADIESLGREVRQRASGLLLTPEGSDSSARAEESARTQRNAEALEGEVTTAAQPAHAGSRQIHHKSRDVTLRGVVSSLSVSSKS